MVARHSQPKPDETAGRPARRQGPRPIALHLAAATTGLLSSLGALPSARLGLLPWHPRLARTAAELTADLARVDPEPLIEALGAEVERRLRLMIAGIDAYRDHPYRRELEPPPVVWRDGASRLLDYRPGAAAADTTVLLVPSLVNRYYVLDLTAERSLARWLAGRGFRPLVVDWGDPSAVERGFTLTDYILGRLGGALDRARELAGGPVAVVGYCMGGNLAAALAQHRAADVAALALLATPWDFHAEMAAAARQFAHAAPAWQTLLDALGGHLAALGADRRDGPAEFQPARLHATDVDVDLGVQRLQRREFERLVRQRREGRAGLAFPRQKVKSRILF